MGEISEILSNELNIKEINDKTLAYRVNGFFYACNLNIEPSTYDKSIQIFHDIYANGLICHKGESSELIVYAIKRQSIDKGDFIHIVGEGEDIAFSFNNYYENKRIDRRIVEIPFDIYVNKIYEGLEYAISIESIINQEVKITLTEEDGNEIKFFANILDFGKVLNIIKAFVNNPEEVVRTYDEIFSKKKVKFTNGDLNKAIKYDEKLDKPVKGIAKVLKKITDNEGNYHKK